MFDPRLLDTGSSSVVAVSHRLLVFHFLYVLCAGSKSKVVGRGTQGSKNTRNRIYVKK